LLAANLDVVSICEDDSNRNVLEIADYKNNNYKKVSIFENTTNVSEIDFKKQGPEMFNSVDLSTIYSSGISHVTNLSDFNSSEWRYLNLTQKDHFKYQESFEYEYDEVEEESEPEETVQDEDFSFLTNGRENNEFNDNTIIAKNQFEFDYRHSDVTTNTSPTVKSVDNKKLSQLLEKSSMTKIMGNQMKIEDSMIRMFNNRINVFPDFRLHSLGLNITKIRCDHMSNSNE